MVCFQKRLWWGVYIVFMIGSIPFLGFAGQSATNEAIQSSSDALSSPEVLAELEGFTSAGDVTNFYFNAIPLGYQGRVALH